VTQGSGKAGYTLEQISTLKKTLATTTKEKKWGFPIKIA
jgi:hypothetical protein